MLSRTPTLSWRLLMRLNCYVVLIILVLVTGWSNAIFAKEDPMKTPNPQDMTSAGIEITFPKDGDVLNHNDGGETEAGLTITLTGMAPSAEAASVNGETIACVDGTFSCPVTLTAKENSIHIQAGNASTVCRVFWKKNSRKVYRFSVDDNIQFLKDLGTAPELYPSLFDHWYLAFWREMHRAYGAKIHFNIYYQTDGFDLTQMPDTWKEEWRDNASWIRLSFHALQDKPDRPYRNAPYTQIAHDHDLVCGHIRRFAGNEVMGTTTTVHWAECTKEGVYALRDRGIRNLIGLFNPLDVPHTTRYYLSPEQSAYCDSRPAWHDHETGITFVPCAIVVNSYKVPDIVPRLEQRASSPHTGELIELLIHEQYFRKELSYFQPDVMDKVRTALDWVVSRGYEPVFWSDELF